MPQFVKSLARIVENILYEPSPPPVIGVAYGYATVERTRR